VDFDFFDEAVRKGADTLAIKLVDQAFLMIKGKEAYSVLALNQE
jgi:hypothetical protein